MKKYLVLGFFLCFLKTIAQSNTLLNIENFDKQRVHWGYFLGANQYDFKLEYKNDTPKDILVNTSVGFNVGLIGDLRINSFLNLRLEPGLYYTQRDLIFPGFDKKEDYLREVKSTYLHIPLLLKISTKRFGNFKPYLLTGASASLNLSSNQNNPQDNSGGIFRMKKNSTYYELGFGIDFYLYYFKFSPSIRGIFSLKNEGVADLDPASPWTGNIGNLQTRGVFINFSFE